MKKLILTLVAVLVCTVIFSQTPQTSKLILKNGDVITGKIIEMKPDEYIKIQIVGNNILEIPYTDVQQIILDASETTTTVKPNQVEEKEEIATPTKNTKPLKDYYFETHQEFAFGLGVGKVYGNPYEYLTGQIVNDDVFAGYYTVNGVGYKNMLFAGIGFGIYGHTGFGDNNEKSKYSIPFMLDVRYRVLPKSKFSPYVMLGTGISYYDGSLGTFSFMDALGLSINISERFNAHILISHNYERFSGSLSVNNSAVEDFYKGLYLNYMGARLGISYKI